MKRAYLSSVLLSVVLLTGCVPSEQQYDTVVTTVQGSAKARKLAMDKCVAGFSASERKAAAMVADTSEKAAPALVCRRIVEAVRSGRMTYSDMVDFRRGKATPKLVKIVQGR